MKQDALIPTKQLYDTTQLGNFISYNIFEEAIKFLDFLIIQKNKNKSFNTLNFHWLRRYDRVNFDPKTYFDYKIANNLFYALVNEFYAVSYQIPKGPFGIRNYKFFSLPLSLVYNSIGLYLVRLSQRIVEHVNRSPNFKIFYGGYLHFENNELVKNYNSVNYKDHYKKFKKTVKNSINPKKEKKIVIKFDVQNFYDSIDINILLNFLDESIKPQSKNQYNFDQNTKEEIEFFFKYLMNGEKGIPQNEKNIMSDYIGALYLIIFDSAVENYFKRKNIQFNYTRYVDDIYISLNQFEGYKDHINDIVQDLEQLLYTEVKLKLNISKLKIYPINNETDFHVFLEELKKVSIHGELAHVIEDENEKTIKSKCDELIDVILDIKSLPEQWAEDGRTVDHIFDYDDAQKEKLKNIYDPEIISLIKTAKYKTKLIKIFTGFNFKLVSIDPIPLLVLICLFEETKALLINSLEESNSNTLQHLLIIETLLLNEPDLVKSSFLSKYLEQRNGQIYPKLLKKTFFDDAPILNQDVILYDKIINWDITKRPAVIEQIKYRFFSEKIGNFSNALNHLVNEIHQICFEMDETSRTQKDYNAEYLIKFLYQNKLDFLDILKIENLFNRRNYNIISHPGLDKNRSWAVKRDEYAKYRKSVSRILGKLL